MDDRTVWAWECAVCGAKGSSHSYYALYDHWRGAGHVGNLGYMGNMSGSNRKFNARIFEGGDGSIEQAAHDDARWARVLARWANKHNPKRQQFRSARKDLYDFDIDHS